MAPPPLRAFQSEVLELARERNVVMVGDTGIGKTFVAIALLGEQEYGGGKRAFFLAPTRQLVWQITEKVRATSTLPAKAYCGRAVELWGAREWERELRLVRVLVCTPEVLRNALERGFVSMAMINLLVFDECHHVTKRHPYAHVIKLYDTARENAMPRIFGTTACPTRDCAKNLHATLKKVELEDHETKAFAAVAPILFETYEKEGELEADFESSRTRIWDEADENDATEMWLEKELNQDPLLGKVFQILEETKVVSVLKKLLRKSRSGVARDDERREKLIRKFALSCVEIYRNLGVWCVYRFLELEIERAAINASMLIHMPGTMYGYDRAAVTALMHVRALRSKCDFAATKRVLKVVSLLQDRLLDKSEDGELQGADDEEESDDDEDGPEGSVGASEVQSYATTEDADVSVVRGEGGSRTDTLTTMSTSLGRPRNSLQGIIFVTTRVECRVLCEYLNEVLGERDEDSVDDDHESDYEDDSSESDSNSDEDLESRKDPRFACVLGQAASRDTASLNLPKMEETLTKFEKGKIQFLVSTAVSIEGVDFPQCSLIIVATRIQTARKLIQLRGRARHEDGVVFYLAEEGDREHESHFGVMHVEAEAINALDFSRDKNETLFQLPRSQAAQQLAGFAYFPEESKLTVESTGAVLDLDSSVSRINMFCQSLPPQTHTIDYKGMYTFKETQVNRRPLFRAMLQLPVELDIPVFKSELMHSKSTAKAAVAFQACKYLLDNGLLDTSLNSVFRRGKTPQNADDLAYFIKRLHT